MSPESRFSSPSSDTTMAACLFYPVDVASPTRPSTACARQHGEGAPLLPGLCVQNRKCYGKINSQSKRSGGLVAVTDTGHTQLRGRQCARRSAGQLVPSS